MAEPGLNLSQPLSPNDASGDASFVKALHAATHRCLLVAGKSSADKRANQRLHNVAARLESRDLGGALREIDRTWRHSDPESLPTLAALYGRLLCLEERDHAATLAMLNRATLGAPDPEIHALIALTLDRNGQQGEARRQIGLALTTFCITPDDLVSRVARSIAFHQPRQTPGWLGLGPTLEARGEILAGESDAALDIAIDGRVAFTRLIRSTTDCSHSGFVLAASSLTPASRVDVTAKGDPLLGSGLSYPPDFAVDGRASIRGHVVTGWARLGWRPLQRPRIKLVDEVGGSMIARVAPGAQQGYRWPFTADLRAAGIKGMRFEISVELPGGGWQPLPDAPLLVERALQPRSAPIFPHRAVHTRTSIQAIRPVDIIIPVYRGREETRACIDSVLRTVGGAAGLIVVDDATDEIDLAADLDELAADGSVTLLRNTSNRGFVRSVNRALALNPAHDVIILNSDTVVFGDWLQRLRSAAYSDQRVGTATPLSNSGSIASYPNAAGGEMPVDQAAAFHVLTADTHPDRRIEIPVGVGFCLYVRRDCLQEVGALDEATFGKGYGEETDFCLRARSRGWSHVLAADVFVYHSGGLSFGSRRTALLERSQRLLNLRFPGYDALVARFLANNPLESVRRRIDEQRLLGLGTRMVLIVTLALTGGVDRFVTERCAKLRLQGLLPLLLRPAAPGKRTRCGLSTADTALPNLVYEVPSDIAPLRDLLQALPLERVEIQHFLHLDARVIEVVRQLGVPYDVFLHDYAWICPRVTLIDGSGRYCGEPEVSVCDRCVRRNGSASGETLSVAALRARSRRWIQEARDVLAPSTDTADRITKYTDRTDITVRPNSSPTLSCSALPGSRVRDTTRVALIGAIGTHKGYRQLLDCARDARKRKLPLEFVVIGYTENDAPLLATGKVFITGRYGEGEASHLLKRESADVAWFPSVWPETWCYTLDEALEAALPIVTFDIGAIAERLRHRAQTSLLPLGLEPRRINDHLLDVGSPISGRSMTPFKRIPRVENNSKMRSQTPVRTVSEHNVTPIDQRAPEGELTAAVQVLPLPSGLYLFSVKAATPSVAASTAALSLPAVHVGLGPGVPSDNVEFVAGPSTHGGWLFAKGDLLVTKIKGNGATLVLTSMRAPGGDALSIKVERLEARADEPPAAPLGNGHSSAGAEHKVTTRSVGKPAKNSASDGETLPIRIGAHIRTRGDMLFSEVPWAGRVAPGLWIESFSIKPLERFSAQDIEYKALTSSGFETPWLSDEKMCGTKGMSTPLLGFAIRLKPSSLAAAYDCEYTGYFQSGHTVGPLRNGVPCRSSVASDPLEGIQVRLIKRSASMLPAAGMVVAQPRNGIDPGKKRAAKKSPVRSTARSSRRASPRRS